MSYMISSDDRLADLHTSYPGKLYNFNLKTQTADVEILIDNLYKDMKEGWEFHPKERLEEIPVQFIRGAGFSLTHPIPDETPCYIFFSMRGQDNWKITGKKPEKSELPPPDYLRRFSFLDAVCIVGIHPVPLPIKEFNKEKIEIRNEDRTLRISLDNKIVEIVAGENYINIDKEGNINISSTKNIKIKTGNIDIEANNTKIKSITEIVGNTSIKGSLSVTDGDTNIKGNLSVSTSIEAGSSLKVGGIEVRGHTHICSGPGSTSGPMQ